MTLSAKLRPEDRLLLNPGLAMAEFNPTREEVAATRALRALDDVTDELRVTEQALRETDARLACAEALIARVRRLGPIRTHGDLTLVDDIRAYGGGK